MNALQENQPLSAWTTFGVGGPARFFLNAQTERDVLDGLDFAKTKRVPVFVLGGGSNLLVADSGFPGLVLRVGIQGMTWEGEELCAAAGEDWDGVVRACVERDLGGVECMSGIPGLAGGTPVQNVGAYGQEIADVLLRVRVLDRRTDSILELTKEQCRFAYRSSVFNQVADNPYIVLAIHYALEKNRVPQLTYPDLIRQFEGQSDPPSLSAVRQAVRDIRLRKGMLLVEGDPDCRSAGSFFKNPVLSQEESERLQVQVNENIPRYAAGDGKVKTSAAWLIERAGFAKGFVMGPAGVSSKHTLALINRGGAKASDLIRLAREIRKRVEDRFGVRLVPEPVMVGFDEVF